MTYSKIALCLIVWLTMECGAQECGERTVIAPSFEKYSRRNDVYFVQLLGLALQKSYDGCKKYKIGYAVKSYSSRRYKSELIKGSGVIDVVWSMPNRSNDQNLQRIDFDVLKGMNGYRKLLVKKSDVGEFSAIVSKEELKQYRAGQAVDWPDVEILRNNGLPVNTSLHADSLHKMLIAGRFDYFPRGIHEIENELAIYGEALSVVKDVALIYSAPVSFYVRKGDAELAQAIDKGLAMASVDGSWDALFFSFPNFRDSMSEMKSASARTIVLEN